MARVSLQIKNVASILLAAVASAASGVTVKMYLDRKSWAIPAVCLAGALSCQLGLIFVESKEEEELSLIRKQRLEAVKAEIAEDRALTARIQHEIKVGDPEAAARWVQFRKEKNGKHDLYS
jgi:hypothetical protein